jgi:hypothetical protein
MKCQTNSVRSHSATHDTGKVRLGDMAPIFEEPAGSRPDIKKNKRDAATQDSGKVRLGDMAPGF